MNDVKLKRFYFFGKRGLFLATVKEDINTELTATKHKPSGLMIETLDEEIERTNDINFKRFRL